MPEERLQIKIDHLQKRSQIIVNILQEIADNGGLGINDPLAWQQEVRKDRPLPLRHNS